MFRVDKDKEKTTKLYILICKKSNFKMGCDVTNTERYFNDN